MPDFPLVTIITPSYNQAEYLEQALQSVLTQDYPNIEYYVMDGGSTDGSREIIERYANRLAGWVSQRDHGQGDAVNQGLARARGEYIGWINSDDLFRPGAISAAVTAFQAHPEAAMVFSDVQAIDATGRVTNLMHYGNWGLDDLMTFHIIGQPGVFMRRSALERSGFLDLRYDLMLDHELWLRLAQQGSMVYVPKAIWAAARFHAAAKNTAQAPHYGKDAYIIVEWMSQQPQLVERYRRLENKIWAGAHRINARYLLDGGLVRESLQAYWKSLKAHPLTALTEWHRMLYALLSLVGLSGLKPVYLSLRQKLKHY